MAPARRRGGLIKDQLPSAARHFMIAIQTHLRRRLLEAEIFRKEVTDVLNAGADKSYTAPKVMVQRNEKGSPNSQKV